MTMKTPEERAERNSAAAAQRLEDLRESIASRPARRQVSHPSRVRQIERRYGHRKPAAESAFDAGGRFEAVGCEREVREAFDRQLNGLLSRSPLTFVMMKLK